ncbi:MAG: glycine zipper 2TM domain-containing protein [Rhodospirillaceae bacterium]|nr:glycine zipper 2TM domain-containing protein [Rhodospirillaceae bacterium]
MKTRFAPRMLVVAAMASALALSGCANDGRGGKETFGTLLGAGLGAWAGSSIGKGSGKVVAVAAGTMLGAAVGNSIGRGLDDVDRMKMREAEQRAYAAPIGEAIVWNNPNTGNSGSITPVRDGRTTGGRYCREFQTDVTVGGKRENAHGTACQEPDGSWRIVEG